MKRFHVHVSVDDLATARTFYATLFGAEPTVLEADYAKWMLDDPRVNFAISTRGKTPGLDHLGIQVETDDELAEVSERLAAAGVTQVAQPNAACCYATGNKSWSADPSGIAWETFHTMGEIVTYGDDRVDTRNLPQSSLRRGIGAGATMMADGKIRNVLFLCTGNSARSILAEAILNREGAGRFRAYSAGSMPAGTVNPFALALLKKLNHPTAGLRSKSWEEFSGADAPQMDFVFTVCDNAANEVCPIWPGQPISAHWGVPDPAAVEGSDALKAAAFADTYRLLSNRIGIFINLPMTSLDRLGLQKRLDEIGRSLPKSA